MAITTFTPSINGDQEYSPTDLSLINQQILASSFDSSTDYVEFTYATNGGSFQLSVIPFTDFNLTDSYTGQDSTISLNTETYLRTNLGYSVGDFDTVYNFFRPQLSSSYNNPVFYLKEISSDRTEIVLSTNRFSFELVNSINEFINQRNTSEYFEDFYLNFGNNNLIIANNLIISSSSPENFSLLVNLYSPFPNNLPLKSTLWVVVPVADSITEAVSLTPPNISIPPPKPFIKGPNFNTSLNDIVNNSTNYVNYSQIVATGLDSSFSQISNIISSSGIEINIDYSNFSNFIHFSSAKQRLENFYYKIQSIEDYTSDIENLTDVNSPISNENIITLQNKINSIVSNFDSYEYFLYFTSGSQYTWPKQTLGPPYILYPSDDPIVLDWYGSDNPSSPYFGGMILDALSYDQDNQDYLYNTIPEYLRDDPQNDPYRLFIEMIGQMYDNIWVYYKDITKLHQADNRLDYGISKDLVAEALKSFGIKIYQNNFSTNNLYESLLGYNFLSSSLADPNENAFIVNNYINDYFLNTPVYVPSSCEYITNYISASFEALITPSDDINKEIYKRLYHNLPYLLKTKGTIPGLRALINCYGIPDTILRISEFGGRDKDISTYDYYHQRYSKAFKPLDNASVLIPWLPLYRNYIESINNLYVWPVGYVAPVNFDNLDYIQESSSALYTVPDCIQFRFKTTGIPPQSHYSQSLLLKLTTGSVVTNPSENQYIVNNYVENYFISDIAFESGSSNWDLGIFLYYTGSGEEYNGNTYYPDYQYGNLRLYISGSSTEGGFAVSEDIYLPFFDGGWWSVMLQRNIHASSSQNSDNVTYTLYAANKIYNGYDGDTIGYISSSSIYVDGATSSSLNSAWNHYEPQDYLALNEGIFLGGFISGAMVDNQYIHPSGTLFTGSLQEFRYYAYALDEKTFKDYTMNPESTEGINLTGSLSSFDILNFRAPLGNELKEDFTYTQSGSTIYELYSSIHPASTASSNILITESFIVPSSTFVNFNVNNPNLSFNTLNDTTYINVYSGLNMVVSSSGPYLSWDEANGNIYVNDTCLGGFGDFTVEGTLDDPLSSTYTVQFILSSSVRGTIESFNLPVTSPQSFVFSFDTVNIYNGEIISIWAISSINDVELTPASLYGLSIEELNIYGVVPLNSYQILYYSSSITASHTDYQTEEYYFDQPIVGLKNRVTEKINITSTTLPYVNMFVTESWNLLSQYNQLTDQNYPSLNSEIPNVNLLEIAFSPQNEIDDDIISSLGYFNIGEYIGDPRYVSSSNTTYVDLDKLRDDYFKKYFSNYSLYDYIRLIKSYDNSLFKLIKDFTPARTSLTSGIVIKSHLLERNRYPQPQMSFEEKQYTGSIDTAFTTGSTGGIFNPYNILVDDINFSTNKLNLILNTTQVNPFINTTVTASYDYITWLPTSGELIVDFYGTLKFETKGSQGGSGNVLINISSSINGIIGSFTGSNNITPYYNCIPGEAFSFLINSDAVWLPLYNTQFLLNSIVPTSIQTWEETTIGPSGSTVILHNSQNEFYNGELPGTFIETTDGELNFGNTFKYPSILEVDYSTAFYPSNEIPLSIFLNGATSPNLGEIYLWYDTGSTTTPAGSQNYAGPEYIGG
jgi:hypothetical protein